MVVSKTSQVGEPYSIPNSVAPDQPKSEMQSLSARRVFPAPPTPVSVSNRVLLHELQNLVKFFFTTDKAAHRRRQVAGWTLKLVLFASMLRMLFDRWVVEPTVQLTAK